MRSRAVGDLTRCDVSKVNWLFHKIWLHKLSKVLLLLVAFCNKFVSNLPWSQSCQCIPYTCLIKLHELNRLLFIVVRNHSLRHRTIKNDLPGVQEAAGFTSKGLETCSVFDIISCWFFNNTVKHLLSLKLFI